jgi:hypothetical protein
VGGDPRNQDQKRNYYKNDPEDACRLTTGKQQGFVGVWPVDRDQVCFVGKKADRVKKKVPISILVKVGVGGKQGVA